MGNILTHDDGNIIAYWRRKPTEQEESAFVGCIRRAVHAYGIDAQVELIPAYGLNCLGAHFGYADTKVVVPLNNQPPAIRTAWKRSVVKGLTRITFSFRRTAGLFDFEEHRRRDSILDHAYETMPRDKFFEYCDGLKWDGDIYEYDAITNGKQRAYRGRKWWRYEGMGATERECGHFGFGNLEEITNMVDSYIKVNAADLGLMAKRVYDYDAA